MKFLGTTFFASALALVAGCSSGSPDAPRGDEAARNTESLTAPNTPRPEDDPCARVRCRAGTECVVVDGSATCAESDTDINPCAAVTCLVGNSCELIDGEPACVPVDDASACAAVSCLAGDTCEVIDGEAVCVSADASACAAVLCGPNTTCQEIDGAGVCTPIEPEVDACAAVRCREGTECVVVDGNAECQPAPPNPCAAVLCEVNSTCEVVDGEAQCTPIESAPFCGGFAGFACPGSGTCVDDPSDDCDPENGGADCGGSCECNVRALCVPGFVFDESAAVCGCVPEPETNPCALVDCFPNQTCEVQDGEAVCVPIETNPCAAVLCPVDTVCVVEGGEASCEPAHECD